MIRRRIRIAAPLGSSVIFFGNSVIRVPLTAPAYTRASGAAAKRLLARYIGVFQAKSGLAPNEILGRCRVLQPAVTLSEQFLLPCQGMRADGLEIAVLRPPVLSRGMAAGT